MDVPSTWETPAAELSSARFAQQHRQISDDYMDAPETLESSQQPMHASRVCSTLGHSHSIAESATSSLSELLGSFPDEGHVEPPASSSYRGGDGGGALGWGMGVVDRLDSAHYEARPAGLLERQDSANEEVMPVGLHSPIGARQHQHRRQDSAASLDRVPRTTSLMGSSMAGLWRIRSRGMQLLRSGSASSGVRYQFDLAVQQQDSATSAPLDRARQMLMTDMAGEGYQAAGNGASPPRTRWRSRAGQQRQETAQQPTSSRSPTPGDRRRSCRTTLANRASSLNAKSETKTPAQSAAASVSEDAVLPASEYLAFARQAVMTDLATNPPPPTATPQNSYRSSSHAAQLEPPPFEHSRFAGRQLQRTLTGPLTYSSAAAAMACLWRDSPMDPLVEARRVVLHEDHDLAERPSMASPAHSPAQHDGEDTAAGQTRASQRAGSSGVGMISAAYSSPVPLSCGFRRTWDSVKSLSPHDVASRYEGGSPDSDEEIDSYTRQDIQF